MTQVRHELKVQQDLFLVVVTAFEFSIWLLPFWRKRFSPLLHPIRKHGRSSGLSRQTHRSVRSPSLGLTKRGGRHQKDPEWIRA